MEGLVKMEEKTEKGKIQMIKIILINDIPYVWDALEYIVLRKDYRICGIIDGAAKKSPRPFFPPCPTLPVRLTRVEALYLIKQGIASAFRIPVLNDPKPQVAPELVEQLKRERKVEQVEAHKRKRRLEIESIVDKIIEGKRRKGRGPVPDRNTVIEEESQKVELPFETTQIDIADPWVQDSDFVPCDIPMPDTVLDILRYKVFEDFHLRRKYFLSSGLKFGGDFLAYPGDPEHFHSEFIIMCHDTSRSPYPLNIQSQIRLAVTVKKLLLVATLDQVKNSVKYKVMNKLRLTVKQEEALNTIKMETECNGVEADAETETTRDKML